MFDIKNASLNKIKRVNEKRNMFMDALQKKGVSTRPATHAVHMLQYYREKYEVIPEDFPNAYIANECSISFPLFNGLTDEEQCFVIKSMKEGYLNGY